MIYYHTFKDLGIEGIYDYDPLLPHYHFPDNSYFQNKNILDVGCASGYFSKYFYERGANVTGLDISTHAAKDIKEKAKLDNWIIVEMDYFDMKFQNQFDFCFCGSLLMHSIYPMILLRNIYNALIENGEFILCTGGTHDNDPSMIVEKGYRFYGMGACESMWWLSKKSGITMLENIGFKNVEYLDSFHLTSTPYGVSINENYSCLHHVWKANK